MLNDLKSQLGDSMNTMRRLFQRPASGDPARSARAQEREERRQRVRRMRRDLYTLLEQHPTSRELMRHLDLVERTLRQQGFAAVEALPVRVIAKALNQLERLVWDWSPVGLAELRSRMAVIVKTRPAEAAPEATTVPEAHELAIDSHQAAEVTEVDHAAFEEMERSWSGRMPSTVAAALAGAKAG